MDQLSGHFYNFGHLGHGFSKVMKSHYKTKKFRCKVNHTHHNNRLESCSYRKWFSTDNCFPI